MLFRAACELGALEGDGDVSLAGRVRRADRRSPSRFSTTSSTSSGPPERTGKPRGADLLDGTVTLPLILARERDPELAALDLQAVNDAGAGRRRVRSDRGDRRARARRANGRSSWCAAAKRELPALPERQRAALELVADGVVERYS